MHLKTLVNAATKYGTHSISEMLYLKTGYDITKPHPIQGIHGVVNERCNYKCRYCNFWRQKEYVEEMTIEQWQAALLSLKEFIGFFSIQFVGGEPFIKKGFLDLLEFCYKQDINWGAITNGSAFNHQTVKKVVAARPLNIDISVDGSTAEIHDYVRGIPGSLDKITQGIGFLREERERLGLKFPIRIQPTVHLLNFRNLPRLVDWSQQVGATSINFHAVAPWTNEVDTELWIRDEADISALRETVETLIAMKKNGMPIETSYEKLRSFGDHFLGKIVRHGVSPCHVGMRDYHIKPNGDVSMCWFYPSIGNVKTHSARDIWYGDKAKQLRAQTLTCRKFGTVSCANSCLAHRTFMQQVKRGLLLIRRVGLTLGSS